MHQRDREWLAHQGKCSSPGFVAKCSSPGFVDFYHLHEACGLALIFYRLRRLFLGLFWVSGWRSYLLLFKKWF